MPALRIALLGFGNVGRRFAALLGRDYGRVLRAAGVRPRITGIATARHGSAIRARGLDPARCLALVRAGRSLDALHQGPPIASAADFIRRVPADVLVELTPLDPRRGEPATSHVRLALGRGLHVVTANKGPVAFALRRLQALARRRRRLFLHEGVVMDGMPVFNLARRCLPGARVLGFRGTLNSTTSHILGRMEEGRTRRRRPARGPGRGHRGGGPHPRPRGLGRGGEGMRAGQRPDGGLRPPLAGAAARDRRHQR